MANSIVKKSDGSLNNKHKVTVLLSRYSDPYSRLVALWSRFEFTHISISLDPEEDVFYSFNLKGFIEEHWHGRRSKYLEKGKTYIYLYVDSEKFERLKKEIEKFQSRKQEMKYSPVGTLLCLARIPFDFKRNYFCSRFVAEVLDKSGIVKLKKKHSLYLPHHILKELGPIIRGNVVYRNQ